jgi:hypothetical protein
VVRVAVGLVSLSILAAACGEEQRRVEQSGPARPDSAHAREVTRNPYALTCGDIAMQSELTVNQKLVIGAQFALADAPVLRKRVREMTENRVGRSIYWAMTEACKSQDASFTPGAQAVAAVRQGRYLVQPRPESWNRPPEP